MTGLVIIPARGGSKRIPKKNIADFAGRPLIAHVLETARDCGLFEEIHVSTDDKEIAACAARLGHAPAFMRDTALADDFVGIAPVLRWVHEQYAARGRDFDRVSLLMATAPLIEAADLRAGHALFERLGGARAVLAVARYPAPIEWAFRLGADRLLSPVEAGKFAVRSQDLEPAWYDSGTFAVFPAARLYDIASDEGFAAYPIDAHKAIDIDGPDDLRFAEIVWHGMRRAEGEGG